MSGADAAGLARRIRTAGSGRHFLFLFDFDGTLVEFHPDPTAVWNPPARRDLLLSLSHQPRTTIGVVSGRRLQDVRARAGVGADAWVAGLHGLEIEGGGERFVHSDVPQSRATAHELAGAFEAAVEPLSGVFVEHKDLSFAVHFRGAPPETAAAVEAILERLARPALADGRLRVMRGACVFELLPNIDWNKGHAVGWILARVEELHGPALPVYIGDDVTDEDAFRALRGRGLTVAASDRVTGADAAVDGPAGVESLLRELTALSGGDRATSI